MKLRLFFALLGLCSLQSSFASAPVSKSFFENWPEGSSPTLVGKLVAEKYLATPHMFLKASHTIHYAEVCTWYGALTFAFESKDKELSARLVSRFDPLFGDEAPLLPAANHVDNSVFGTVPLELYIQTSQPKYRILGLSYADGQWDRPLPNGLTRQTRYWIDDMFMITSVQLQAYRATGNEIYLNRAAEEMVAYLERLQQPNGLFFHHSDIPFFWGRGDGWVAAGMAELLRSMPETHPRRAQIMTGYRKMMAALLQNQREDGMWRQLIDRPEAWPETSCTGMFAFAFITGVKQGWLDPETYGPAARKAWIALIGYLNPDGTLREVCMGTGTKNDLQYYLDRPRIVGDFHGQAPILWCATALIR
jgi:rhamnogalacturonyl hydrolase YesR